jgi:hypothetical protein
MQEPVGVREVVGSPATAHLHDRHFVALFDQTVRADAAAKTGADDDEVKIELPLGSQTDLLCYRLLYLRCPGMEQSSLAIS